MSFVSLSAIVALIIVCVGFIYPLRLSWRSKAIMGAIALLASSKSFLYILVGGSPFEPDIPYNLSFVFDITRVTMLFLSFLVVLRFIGNAIYRAIKLSWFDSLLPTFSLFHAQLMLIVSFVLACYGTSCAYSTPEVQPYTFTLERLDPRLDGMQVVVVSDLHISSLTNAAQIYDLVKQINALKPDLILLPGDLIDGDLEDRRPLTDLLFDLKAKFGVYITTGNHEYYANYQEWRNYFEQGGFISLDNKVVELRDVQQQPLLNLGGITDPRAAEAHLPTPDIKGVIAALNTKVPNIILSHRPQYAPDFAASKQVDLVVAGHTHGGLALGINKLIASNNGGFVSGLYQLGKTNLVVGNGIMIWVGLPIRLGVPSQVVLLTLHSNKRPQAHTMMLTRKADDKIEAALANNAKAMAQIHQKATTAAGNNAAGASNTGDNTTGDSFAAGASDAAANALMQDENIQPGNAFTDLQLFLPMQDATDGSIKRQLTHVAILPDALTPDQMQRIGAIINEDQETRALFLAQKQQQKALLKQKHAAQIDMVVRKDSTTLEQQNKAIRLQTAPLPDLSAAATTGTSTSTTTTMTTDKPALSGPQNTSTNRSSKNTLSLKSPEQAFPAPDESRDSLLPIQQLGNDDSDLTLEVQTEYAISLDSAAQGLNDGSVELVDPQNQSKSTPQPLFELEPPPASK